MQILIRLESYVKSAHRPRQSVKQACPVFLDSKPCWNVAIIYSGTQQVISKLHPHSKCLKAVRHRMTLNFLDKSLLKYYERTDTAFPELAYYVLFNYVIILSVAHTTAWLICEG